MLKILRNFKKTKNRAMKRTKADEKKTFVEEKVI